MLVLGVKISALANRTLNQKLNDINKIMRVRNAWFVLAKRLFASEKYSGEISEGITITNLYTDF